MELGDLSAKYESNGDCGSVSNCSGDAGGTSYGCYQFATNAGVPQAFVAWLQSIGNQYGDTLANAGDAGSDGFNQAWQNIANNDSDTFFQLQHDYVKSVYYDTAVEELRNNNYNINNHNEVMKNVIWSRAVQYGTGNIVEMFTDAVHSLGYDNLSYVDSADYDANMIKAIYLNVCSTPEWTNGSPDLREGLYNRFQNECNDALAMLENDN